MPGFTVLENVMAQELDEEFVLVDLQSGSYFGARGVAATIWSLLSQGAGKAEITRQVAERYDGDPREIEQDVQEFLSTLVERGLVRPASDEGEASA